MQGISVYPTPRQAFRAVTCARTLTRFPAHSGPHVLMMKHTSSRTAGLSNFVFTHDCLSLLCAVVGCSTYPLLVLPTHLYPEPGRALRVGQPSGDAPPRGGRWCITKGPLLKRRKGAGRPRCSPMAPVSGQSRGGGGGARPPPPGLCDWKAYQPGAAVCDAPLCLLRSALLAKVVSDSPRQGRTRALRIATADIPQGRDANVAQARRRRDGDGKGDGRLQVQAL